ncbi:MAG: hypothetical protein KKE94_00945 [Gammaproteobacteria bacterium]|nr:hypothetical protein [Gammaproteobacteria bacterium]
MSIISSNLAFAKFGRTKNYKFSDQSNLPEILERRLWIFDDVAKACLEEFIRPYAEFLPLQCEKQELYLLNVFHVVDAVDLNGCLIACPEQIDWSDPDPAIIEYAFIESVVENTPLFRVPYSNITKVFFTNRFIEEVEKHGLTGFGYRRLWSSE